MKIFRNISSLIFGIIIGSIVNMFFINISGSIIPPPIEIDVTTEEGLIAAMPLFEPKHFIFPFLAHAIGTLVGAFLAALIAKTNSKTFSFTIGFIFLIGGISMVFIVPSPLWFTIIDLVFAYLPMAYFGYVLATKFKK